MAKKYYVTTPIYYANGSPHIGHFLTTTVADILARYHRLENGEKSVFFTTGLDEHGTTVEQSAKKAGYKLNNIQKYIDKRALEWKKAFDDSEISYDYFVRTTNPKHKKHAQEFIKGLKDTGDVYKDTYIGKYCNGCEKFLTLSDQNEKGLCPLHRSDQVIETKEDNYFFKLSKYAPQIIKLIKEGKIDLKPNNKKNEILSRLSEGVENVSISRPIDKVSWGIEFPDDPGQTIYVWVEALINYTSSLDINNNKSFWKNSYHILGKDISWFHNVIWPALLLSAGKPLFKGSFVHSFLNIGGEKISKSKGNVITPSELIERYGIDGTRYLILSNLPYKNDSDVTWEYLDQKYNADLANGLGNLVSRIGGMFEGLEIKLVSRKGKKISPRVSKHVDSYSLDRALEQIWKDISKLDIYINENKVWKLDGKEKTEAGVFLVKHLSQISYDLKPFLPKTSDDIDKLIKGKISKPNSPLFPRLDT